MRRSAVAVVMTGLECIPIKARLRRSGVSIRALKTAIIVMGVLIVICLAVLVTAIVRRGASGTVAGNALIAVPAGATVEGEALDGRRVLLRLRLADGRQRLLIADTETGRTLGHLDLVSEPGEYDAEAERKRRAELEAQAAEEVHLTDDNLRGVKV